MEFRLGKTNPYGGCYMSYSKSCNKCGNTIFLLEINGRWAAYEDSSASIYHKCVNGSKSMTMQDKILFLERKLSSLIEAIRSNSERISRLEDQK